MDPGLNPEQMAIVNRVAELRPRFAERAPRYDIESSFPVENYADLRKAGLLGMTVPKEYGGLGVDWPTYAFSLLEMAKGDSATALTFNMHAVIVDFIASLGTAAQKKRWFSEVVDHGKLVSSVTSEPQSSFRHKFVLTTTFKPVDGGYLLNGVKHFASLGEFSDYHFVSALIEGTTTAREGQRSALVAKTTKGITVERNWNAMGMRGTASDTIRYENCLVPEEDCLGGIAALAGIDITGFGLGYAAIYLGIGEAAFDYVLDYVKTKSFQLPEPLSQHPSTQRSIGEMATQIRAGRAFLREAAQVKMQGDRVATTLVVNEAKGFCTDAGVFVTDRAIRLAGGRGILKAYPLERWHRDAMCGPVMSPANERCLETAGKILCGLEGKTLEYV